MLAPGERVNGLGARAQCQTGGIRQLGVHKQVRGPGCGQRGCAVLC